jgi:hypothetical protein
MPSARLRAIASGIDDVVHALGVDGEPAGMFFEEILPDGDSPALKRRHAR